MSSKASRLAEQVLFFFFLTSRLRVNDQQIILFFPLHVQDLFRTPPCLASADRKIQALRETIHLTIPDAKSQYQVIGDSKLSETAD